MSDHSITSQLLLAVRAREVFRAETDSSLAPKVTNIFPGAAQQSLKVTLHLVYNNIEIKVHL